ncbi:Hsp20/alpha crystallin family protein [Georgenia sp. M64]|uniref:Hsp20/alpha crystallin family protein n=1 Tax=Georgenia sp. M64 TaxID=3120520 RepID=UPI0030DFC3FE
MSVDPMKDAEPAKDVEPTNEPEQRTAGAVGPLHRSPRELAEQLWESWPFGDFPWPFREAGRPAGVPIRVEEHRDGDHVVVRAELPGVDPEKDIDVTVEDGILTIRAERRESTEKKEDKSYRSEFRYGSFVRRLPVPRGVRTEDVSASYRDGVLEVRLPAPPEETPPRKVQVQRG